MSDKETPKEEVKETAKVDVKPEPTPAPKPVITPTPAPKPEPKPEPVKPPVVASRIKQQIDLYLAEAASTKATKVPAVRLYDLIMVLKKDATDANMDAVIAMFKKEKNGLLNDYNALKGADKLRDIKKSGMVGVFYTLCIAATDLTQVKSGAYSAGRCRDILGEELFLWFNKKFPKKTFVN